MPDISKLPNVPTSDRPLQVDSAYIFRYSPEMKKMVRHVAKKITARFEDGILRLEFRAGKPEIWCCRFEDGSTPVLIVPELRKVAGCWHFGLPPDHEAFWGRVDPIIEKARAACNNHCVTLRNFCGKPLTPERTLDVALFDSRRDWA